MPVISTNIAANSAVRYLNINSKEQTSSLSKLASGSRINQAMDDAAGLAISTRISSDITALQQASVNASHGISVLQTADGGASNISDILQRMKALSSQSASGTVTDNERAYIQAEFEELIDEVDGIAESTRYNGASLLDGTSDFADDGITVMVGSDATDTVAVNIDTLTTQALRISYTDGVLAESAETATAASVSFTVSATATAAALWSINGTNVNVGNGDTAATVAANITASAAGVTATVTGTTMTITNNTTGSAANLTINAFPAMGVGTALSAAGTDAGDPASIELDFSTDLTVGADETFAINGTEISLAAGTYDEAAFVAAVQAALPAGSNLTLTAGTDVVTIESTDPDTNILLDAFEGLTAGDFGLTTNRAAGTIAVDTQANAIASIDTIDAALDVVSKARANIGALESRFSFRSDSIATSLENLEASNSAIADVDVASEAAKLASARVKTQAAVASAAQASQMPQDLLKLLQ